MCNGGEFGALWDWKWTKTKQRLLGLLWKEYFNDVNAIFQCKIINITDYKKWKRMTLSFCFRMELLKMVLSNCLAAIFKWPRMERSS